MSDGETCEEAEAICRDAVQDWLDQAHRDGIFVPPAAAPRAVA